jgi:hypothetical protein
MTTSVALAPGCHFPCPSRVAMPLPLSACFAPWKSTSPSLFATVRTMRLPVPPCSALPTPQRSEFSRHMTSASAEANERLRKGKARLGYRHGGMLPRFDMGLVGVDHGACRCAWNTLHRNDRCRWSRSHPLSLGRMPFIVARPRVGVGRIIDASRPPSHPTGWSTRSLARTSIGTVCTFSHDLDSGCARPRSWDPGRWRRLPDCGLLAHCVSHPRPLPTPGEKRSMPTLPCWVRDIIPHICQ